MVMNIDPVIARYDGWFAGLRMDGLRSEHTASS
jgi:hypothetical protein